MHMSLALRELAVKLGAALRARNQLLVTAESCTGGWIAKELTDIAGSSAWFERGFITYSNAAKQDLLDVPESCLVNHGAVSAEAVTAMARGALARSQADIAIAVSGIAGPAGGSPEKPVGTVWLAWAIAHEITTRQYCFDGDRDKVRYQAVIAALEGLDALLNQDKFVRP